MVGIGVRRGRESEREKEEVHERDEAESSWTGFRMSEPEELSKSDDAACLPEEPTKARGAWHGLTGGVRYHTQMVRPSPTKCYAVDVCIVSMTSTLPKGRHLVAT